jgi:hypothetical protein
MDNKLTYQQARRIRGTKLTDLLADQLLYEPSIGKAIGRTVSLKTQARVKAIKERFDPLNIINKLTFGSAFATSLFGRMTGREAKDIQYFTGRLVPIRPQKTASKITPTPTMDRAGVDVSGINEQLRKIYTFLSVAQENEKQRRDKENNFKEEKQLEDERRHKELIKALTKITGASVPIKAEPVKKEAGGIFDFIKDMFKGMIDAALGAFSWLNDLKGPIVEVFKTIGKIGLNSIIRLFSLIGTPAFLGVALGAAAAYGVKLLLEKLVQITPDFKQLTPAEASAALESPAEIKKQAQARFKKEDVTKEEIEQTKKYLEDRVLYGRAKALDIVEMDEGEEKEKAIREFGGKSLLEKTISDTNVYKLPTAERVIEGPEKVTPKEQYIKVAKVDKNAAAKKWDRLYGETHDPVTGIRKDLLKGTTEATENESAAETARLNRQAGIPEENESAAETSRLMRQSIEASDKTSFVPSNMTNQLNTLMSENVEVNMPKRAAEAAQQVINNVSNLQRGLAPETLRLSSVNIRNDEPTFVRMIMDSTRVV